MELLFGESGTAVRTAALVHTPPWAGFWFVLSMYTYHFKDSSHRFHSHLSLSMDLLAYGCTESMPALASDQQHGADSTDDQLKERLVMMARQGARRPDSDYMRLVQANEPATAESITPIFRRRIVEWMLAVFNCWHHYSAIGEAYPPPPLRRSKPQTRRWQQASISWTAAFPSGASHGLQAS